MGMAYGKEFPAQTPFQCDGLSLGSLLKALSHSDEKVIMALLQLRTYTHICAQQASTLEDVDFNVCSVPYFFRGGGENCPSCLEIDANSPQMPPKQNIFVLLKQYFFTDRTHCRIYRSGCPVLLIF